tara:strand:- start:2183 stop:4399 length:2217 start_codon:yes stop_codon:yes gene_type:complete
VTTKKKTVAKKKKTTTKKTSVSKKKTTTKKKAVKKKAVSKKTAVGSTKDTVSKKTVAKKTVAKKTLPKEELKKREPVKNSASEKKDSSKVSMKPMERTETSQYVASETESYPKKRPIHSEGFSKKPWNPRRQDRDFQPRSFQQKEGYSKKTFHHKKKNGNQKFKSKHPNQKNKNFNRKGDVNGNVLPGVKTASAVVFQQPSRYRKMLELLEQISEYMKLAGENPFKIKAFDKAYSILSERKDAMDRINAGTLMELDGIGKGINEVVTEFVKTGKSTTLTELQKGLPEGLVELVKIPGLGPKKAMTIIEELSIKTIGELEYACRENRLLKINGFGEKVQEKVLQGITFLKSSEGKIKWIDAKPITGELLGAIDRATGTRVEVAGQFRRKLEVISEFDFVLEGDEEDLEKAKEAVDQWKYQTRRKTPVNIHLATADNFGSEWVKRTSSEDHWKAYDGDKIQAASEPEFYRELGLEWVSPEMRETSETVQLAKSGELNEVLPTNGIRGVFHTHTTASDGANTLEEIVEKAYELGYEFIGISDHSQSAFYAQGLSEEKLKEQKKEVDRVQRLYPDIRIFWGIESDILKDGSLDYPDSILKEFDFVIASVHSRFGMDEETMTQRMVQAIRNPYTRMIGHISGRLILGRDEYPVNMETLIEEAAKHDVAIEINANPSRLDIDWRWGPTLRKYGTLVSVNPDAHDLKGLEDTHYGVVVARKALIPQSKVINARSIDEVEKWLKRK